MPILLSLKFIKEFKINQVQLLSMPDYSYED